MLVNYSHLQKPKGEARAKLLRFLTPAPSDSFYNDMSITGEEWVKTLEDGRKVKFIYQELPEDGAFITAQLAGNEVVYSILLTQAKNPLSREDVESRFKGELSKK
jgi:hypothetical protein